MVEGHDITISATKEAKELGVNVSDFTMYRALKRGGLSLQVKQNILKLVKKYIKDCIVSARRY